MKYLDRSFSVTYGSATYRANWARTFAAATPSVKPEPEAVDLVLLAYGKDPTQASSKQRLLAEALLTRKLRRLKASACSNKA